MKKLNAGAKALSSPKRPRYQPQVLDPLKKFRNLIDFNLVLEYNNIRQRSNNLRDCKSLVLMIFIDSICFILFIQFIYSIQFKININALSLTHNLSLYQLTTQYTLSLYPTAHTVENSIVRCFIQQIISLFNYIYVLQSENFLPSFGKLIKKKHESRALCEINK